MNLGPIETGLMIYGVLTVYWSILGAYMLVKTNLISSKSAPFIVIYSVFAWIVGRIMYIYFPEIPPHPILILSGIVIGRNAPQIVLSPIYVYVNTGIINLKWKTYLLLYSFWVGVDRLITYLFRFLPVPEILVLPPILAGWASYPAWFYVYVKANNVFSLKAASLLISYQIFAWIIPLIMLYYLSMPFSLISLVQTFLEYPIIISTLILIDRYRLKKLGAS